MKNRLLLLAVLLTAGLSAQDCITGEGIFEAQRLTATDTCLMFITHLLLRDGTPVSIRLDGRKDSVAYSYYRQDVLVEREAFARPHLSRAAFLYNGTIELIRNQEY